jgi:hypothetical protein
MPERWRGNRQTISWFIDIHRRGLLDLDPAYQRRSVWNLRYRQDFVETVLLGYPAPSLFLHEDIDADGRQAYAVVDGKQRLTAVMDFVNGAFTTREDFDVKLPPDLRGVYFKDLAPSARQGYFSYEFTVEYMPSTDELVIAEVFDRINRNVAKLSRQELRNARHRGAFATIAEELSDAMLETLPPGFPRIVESSRRQMKDVEFTVQLILLVERGPSSTGQDELDRVYAERDDEWDDQEATTRRFRRAVAYIDRLARASDVDLPATRLRNQGDFYALVGAVAGIAESNLPDPTEAAVRLREFVTWVDARPEEVSSDARTPDEQRVDAYYDAARSAANDPGKRSTRIDTLRHVILNES